MTLVTTVWILNGPGLALLGQREPEMLLDWLGEADALGAKAVILNAAVYPIPQSRCTTPPAA